MQPVRLLMASVLLALTAAGAEPGPRAPAEAAQAYFAAVRAGGISNVTPLIHPDELAAFKVSFTPTLQALIREPGPRSIFAAFLEPNDRTRIRPLSNEAFFFAFLQAFAVIQPETVKLLQAASVEVLGTIPEKEFTHVLIRTRVPSAAGPVDSVTVLTTRPHNGEPRLLLPPEIRNLAAAIKAQL